MLCGTGWSGRRIEARGLEILGPDAAPVVPELIQRLGNDQQVSTAAAALASIGKPALWRLMEVLTNRATPDHVRAQAAYTLGLMGTGASESADVLVALLQDKPQVAASAATALANVATNMDDLVPTLTRAAMAQDHSTRLASITALGRFGAYARPAIPVLETFLTNEDASVRWAATNALSRISKGRLGQ